MIRWPSFMCVALLAAALGAACFWYSGFELLPIHYDVVSETLSPDGKWIATVFRPDAGATTGFATALSLRLASEEFDPPQQPWLFYAKGELELQCSWTKPDELLIISPAVRADDILAKMEVARGITIRYR